MPVKETMAANMKPVGWSPLFFCASTTDKPLKSKAKASAMERQSTWQCSSTKKRQFQTLETQAAPSQAKN